MEALIRKSSKRELAYIEMPALAISMLAIEIVPEFGSFTLELAGFLTLWFGLSAAFRRTYGRKVAGLD